MKSDMKRTALASLCLMVFMTAAGLCFASGRPASPSATDPLQVLPDGVGIAVIDVKGLTGSNLWAQFTAPGKTPRVIQNLENHLNSLGLKFSDLQSAAVSFSAVSMNGAVMAVTGTFNQDDVLSRLRADKTVTLSSETYKNLTVYSVAGAAGAQAKHNVSFAFVDPGTVVVGSPAGVKSVADVGDGTKQGIANDATIQSALGEAGQAAIRFALVPPAGMFASAQSEKVPLPDFSSIKLIFGTISVNSGIDLNATLRNDTADHAQAIAQQLNDLLTMVKGMLGSPTDPKKASLLDALKSIQINAAGQDVKVTGSVSNEALSKLIH